MDKIVVIGSTNMDFITETNRFPNPGETLLGIGFQMKPGGKGANQAVACAKLGKKVTLISAVGKDEIGKQLEENLHKYGINTCLKKVDGSSGIAQITVSSNDNSIIVVKGANDLIDIDWIEKCKKEILSADILLLQLEIPLTTIEYVLKMAYQNHIPVILNPAPAHKIPKEWMEYITFLTPNEHEISYIFEQDEESVLKTYPGKVITTKGSKGSYTYSKEKVLHVSSFKRNVVDTTGAGDTFNGALACAWVDQLPLEEMMKFASRCASMAVTKLGAQSAMPTLDEVILDIERSHYEENRY